MMDEVLKEHEEQNEEERRSRILRNSKANESYNKSNKSKGILRYYWFYRYQSIK